MLMIFLDTETSGCDPSKHRILDIAYKIYDTSNWRALVGYESIVCQGAEIWAEADPDSLKINGFTFEELLQGKSEKAIASEIIADINGSNIQEKSGVFICQNPAFDRAFFLQLISEELQREFNWPYHWLDLASMYYAKRFFLDKQSVKSFREKDLSKDEIAKVYGLPPEMQPHRAMRGVEHLLECFHAVFDLSHSVSL